jgi:hypothetical protein
MMKTNQAAGARLARLALAIAALGLGVGLALTVAAGRARPEAAPPTGSGLAQNAQLHVMLPLSLQQADLRADLPRPATAPPTPELPTPDLATKTPEPPAEVTGTVVLAGGAETTGGPVGDTIQIPADFTATSSGGPVTEMRLASGFSCVADPNQLGAWAAFEAHRDFPYQIRVPNIVGFYVTAQFRDQPGNVSAPVCDDISVEGMAPTPTAGAATGRIHGRYTEAGQPLPAGYGAEGLPQIELQRCLSLDCETMARGITEEGGTIEFVNPPALGSGQYYQVVWVNFTEDQSGANPELVYRWWSRKVTTAEFGSGQDVDVGVMELHDLTLKSPCHDCLQTLPITFKWEARANPADVYRWSLFKECGHDQYRINAYRSEPLGRQTQYTVSSPPGGFDYDEKYCWFLHIDNGTNGTGTSYYAYRITFCSSPATCR